MLAELFISIVLDVMSGLQVVDPAEPLPSAQQEGDTHCHEACFQLEGEEKLQGGAALLVTLDCPLPCSKALQWHVLGVRHP